MALKPTIYKFNIALSDLDRAFYDSISLTVARHPSETTERMMVRLLAYCINAGEGLELTRGVSAVEEPDLWRKGLDGQILLWVDVGEPSAERVKKAVNRSLSVKVYSFNTKSAAWWDQSQRQLQHPRVQVYRMEWPDVEAVARLCERTNQMSVTISEGSAYIATDSAQCQVPWVRLDAV